jgi:GntR family transcriptional regulator / MocR family aminotransferase
MKVPKFNKSIEPSFPLRIVLPEPGSNKLMHSLHAQLRAAIGDARLAAGVRLPPTRALAASLGVSRNTVCAAYDLLLSEGYITTLPGASGTRVASALPPSKKKSEKICPDDLLSLAHRRLQPVWRACLPPAFNSSRSRPKFDFLVGVPDQSYVPFDIWGRLLTRTLRQLSKRPAGYDNPQGSPALREAIAEHVSVTRAVACDSGDVLITAGAQQAFDLLARVLVTPGRTIVAVENPGYPPLRDVFLSHGATLITVPVDNEGIIVEQLPKNVRVICVTPSHQFPTGVVMSARRRAELMAFAVANDACIIEDDYDSEFRFGGRPLDALRTLDRDALVFYVGTFSKSLFPALRLGFVAMPSWANSALTQAKCVADSLCATHLQETLAAFMTEGHFSRHLRKMHRVYDERRQIMLTALARHCDGALVPTGSIAGLHLGVHYSSKLSIQTLQARGLALGLRLESFSNYAFKYPIADGLALGYGAIDAQNIEDGVRLLAQILKKRSIG